jgi:hypothetical protein
MSESGEDRRIWYRIDCTLRGVCKVQGKQEIVLQVRDISFDGIGFLVLSPIDHQLQVGDRALIELYWDDMEGTTMDAEAEVRHVTDTLIGAQWIGRPKLAKILISDYLP